MIFGFSADAGFPHVLNAVMKKKPQRINFGKFILLLEQRLGSRCVHFFGWFFRAGPDDLIFQLPSHEKKQKLEGQSTKDVKQNFYLSHRMFIFSYLEEL